MFRKNSYHGIDNYAISLIRSKAKQLVGKAGLTEDDRPDLEQDLMIDLLERLEHFNPAKGKKSTFMTRIVERRISNIFESRFAQCRDWRKSDISLNNPVSESAEWIDLVSIDGFIKYHGQESKEQLTADIGFDIEQVIKNLPVELQDLCEKLASSNMAEIAREMGIPRSTLYDKLTKLRNAFWAAGLDNYI